MPLVNGSFESPVTAANTFTLTPATGWTTGSAAPANRTEIWHTPFTAGVPGVLPYPDGGNQLVEIDVLALYMEQVFTVPAVPGIIDWGFWHHRRNVTQNVLEMRLGDGTLPIGSAELVATSVAADNVWHHVTGFWHKPAGMTSVRLRLTSSLATTGTGNLVDGVTAVFVSGNVPCGCCPTFGTACRTDTNERLFACRTDDGVLHWYGADGLEVDASSVGSCR